MGIERILKTSLDRRKFIVGAAGVGMVAAVSTLTGCMPSSENGSSSQNADAPSASQAESPTKTESTVYFTHDISSDGLQRAFAALGVTPQGNTAVKLSTGEPGGHNFLDPNLIAGLVQGLDATIVECNTAYGGPRSNTESHLQAAADHGFTAIANVDIMDAEGSLSLPVNGGSHLSEDLVGSHFENYNWFLSLAHFKGHAMGGFGGAIKNCSIGFASREGKMLIHSAGESTSNWGNPSQDAFLESMAEAAKAVSDYLAGNICYVNVMNNLSVDCDCDSHPADPEMADIGILVSADPVALDRACVDLVYQAEDSAALIERIESRNGAHTLDHAEAIGLGIQSYELIDIDNA